MGKCRVFWKLYGNDPLEATHRRRGLFVIDGLRSMGWDVSTDNAADADIVVLQRSTSPAEVDAHRLAGKTTIFDVNDCHTIPGPFYNPSEAEIIRESDFVVTNSRWMRKRYARINPNTTMIHEALEDDFFDGARVEPEIDDDRLWFSWHGSNDNLQYVEPVLDAFRVFGDRVGIVFVMAPTDASGRCNSQRIVDYGVPSTHVTWDADTWIDVISKVNAGIAPLPDTEFCRCKGHHKAVGYMALGMSCIASDLPQYREVITHGLNGFIARTTDDWVKCIEMLFDTKIRASVGKRAAKSVGAFKRECVGACWDKFLTMIVDGGFD